MCRDDGHFIKHCKGDKLNKLAQAPEALNQPDLWGAGIKTVAMLSIVVAVLIVVLYLIKRFVYNKQGLVQGGLIDVISLYHVSPKERIGLVDVAGEKLVVGITPESITCLTTITNPEVKSKIAEAKQSGVGKGLFKRILDSSVNGQEKSRVK